MLLFIFQFLTFYRQVTHLAKIFIDILPEICMIYIVFAAMYSEGEVMRENNSFFLALQILWR